MAQKKLSKAQMREAVDAVALHGNRHAAARALKMPAPTLQNRIRQAEAAGIRSAHENVDSAKSLAIKVKKLEAALRIEEKRSSELAAVKAIIGSLNTKVEEYEPPAWTIEAARSARTPHGVPTLFLSDLHWGEVIQPAQINYTNKYNIAIAHERMQTCVTSAIHLLKILSPKMEYPGIVVPLGGDNISGNIHDELTATNELNSMPTVLDLYGVKVGVIEELADTFGRVFLPCVSGNHGRDTPKMWNKDRHATSFDWLLYQFLAKHFAKDKRITFFIPDGPDAFYKIYDHRYLLTHGDQFRGGDSMIGCLGPILRGDHKKRTRNAAIDMEFDTMIMGHWHQYIHHSRVIVNGSLKGYDEYAYNNNFGFERPQQALWLTHPKYGITYRMPVYVDNKRAPAKTTWVSVPEGK